MSLLSGVFVLATILACFGDDQIVKCKYLSSDVHYSRLQGCSETDLITSDDLNFTGNFTVYDLYCDQVVGNCPKTAEGDPVFSLKADVPAYAEAKCKNGNKLFTPNPDGIAHMLQGSFRQDYSGPGCQVYKKAGSNTYTVEIEYGWGDDDSQVITYRKIQTLSCAYDQFGDALSSVERVKDAILAPLEVQDLVGSLNTGAIFDLHVMDVLDEAMKEDTIDIGRKIRLYATDKSNTIVGFRAVSCVAENGFSRYPILVAGCGDGLVLPQTYGFQTQGNAVFSPYFRAFKLRGSDDLKFTCNFTVCDSYCDGSSCSTETKRRRSVSESETRADNRYMSTVTVSSIIVMAASYPELNPVEGHTSHWMPRTPALSGTSLAADDDPGQEQLKLNIVAAVILVFMCSVATVFAVCCVFSAHSVESLHELKL